ncbi:MAG: hypothetical protein H0U76_00905, partial [Ktedonobacteraceae bacterium]|nr:hypothetical protein [Ktedonobacteraceae bacterium]
MWITKLIRASWLICGLLMAAVMASAANNPDPCYVNATITFADNPIILCRSEGKDTTVTLKNTGAQTATFVFSAKLDGGTVKGLLARNGPFSVTLAPNESKDFSINVKVVHDSPRGTTSLVAKATSECIGEVTNSATVQCPEASGRLTALSGAVTLCPHGHGTGTWRVTNTGRCRETFIATATLDGQAALPLIISTQTFDLEGSDFADLTVDLIGRSPLLQDAGGHPIPFTGKVTMIVQEVDGPLLGPSPIPITTENCNPDGGTGVGGLRPPTGAGSVSISYYGSAIVAWANEAAGSGQFRLNATVSPGNKVTNLTVNLTYSFSDPDLVTEELRPYGYVTKAPPGSMRIYVGNHLVRSGVTYSLKDLGVSDTIDYTNLDGTDPVTQIVTFFDVRGVHESDQPEQVNVHLSGTGLDGSASVDCYIPRLDLMVDAENTKGPSTDQAPPVPYLLPDGNDEEEARKYTLPGKLVPINDLDTDDDGIPDYAEGFDYTVNGVSQSEDNASQCFTPFIVAIKGATPPKYLDDRKIEIDYVAASPDQINNPNLPSLATTGDPLLIPWNVGQGGSARIWKKDGNKARTFQNDYVKSRVAMPLSDLGINQNNKQSILYLECVRPGPVINLSDLFLGQSNGLGYVTDIRIKNKSLVAIIDDASDYFTYTGVKISTKQIAVSTFGQVDLPISTQTNKMIIRPDNLVYNDGYLLKSGIIFQSEAGLLDFVKDWTIDWSKCAPTAFLLARNDTSRPGFFYPQSHGVADAFTFTETTGFQILGGYADNAPEPQLNREQSVYYVVNAPTLSALFSVPKFPGRITVTPAKVTIQNVYDSPSQSFPSYLPPPYGSPSLLGARGAVHLPNTVDLRDRNKYDFDSDPITQGANTFYPLRHANPTLGDDQAVRVWGWTSPDRSKLAPGIIDNDFLITGLKTGVSVYEVGVKIGQTTQKILRIPIEVEPIGFMEPDLPALTAALQNVSLYRYWQVVPPVSDADFLLEKRTPKVGDANYRLPRSGCGFQKFLPESSRNSCRMLEDVACWFWCKWSGDLRAETWGT